MYIDKIYFFMGFLFPNRRA